MSANNVLIIVLRPDGLYRGYDRCADDEDCDFIGPKVYSDECGVGIEQPKFEVSTLIDAVRAAEKYVSHNVVEYGYRFLNLPNGKETKDN